MYTAYASDGTALDRIKAKRDQIARECEDHTDSLQVTSFTLNGQSGAGELMMTKVEWLTAYNILVKNLTNGGRLSTRQTNPVF